ncbi:hypothetical protein MKW94_024767 [Papaver nudicaule]|uniref:CCHC-type domain-containing protein n=1 Tax=Papaver nudicaule TaxID=74823 RepID=A0AA41SGL3_PAPNU|nr:hypothetical protein [Papaver nudicaule]
MSRRGNTRGNNNEEAPSNEEMMRLMAQTLTAMTNQTAALTALIQNQNRNNNTPQPPPAGNTDGAQVAWLNLLEKFVRLGPPQFEGSTDPMVVDKWKEDIEKMFVAMRFFQLSGEARNWWKNEVISSGLDENTLTYAEFYGRFDARYFPAVVRHKKIKEFTDLEQVKPMLVDDYLNQYISLQRFGHFMVPDEDKAARKFENGLGDHIRSKVISHCFPTFQQVVNSARATEADWLRNREARQRTSNARHQGTRNEGNGDPRNDRNNSTGWKRQRSENETVNAAPTFYCYNCWDAGHKSNQCTNPNRPRPAILNDIPGPIKHARVHQQNFQNQNNGQNKTNPNQGRFHALVPRQDQVPDGVVEGMFLIHNKLGGILFDSGASHSFIAATYVCDLSIEVLPCETPLSVMSPLGKTTLIDRIVRG